MLSIVITHIELSNETGHIVVFVVERQEFSGKLSLILDNKTSAIL